MLVPVIAGSGGSTGQILAGVGLIAASFLFPGSGLFGASAFGVFGPLSAGTISTLTTVGTAISAIGASLVLGGVANMLSPQPEMPKLSGRRMETTNFNGPGAQGITRGSDGEQSRTGGQPTRLERV